MNMKITFSGGSNMPRALKITFIGGGNMALALIGGLLRQGVAADNLTVIERLPEQREKLARESDKLACELNKPGESALRVLPEADVASLAADLIVLAVKPQQTQEAITPLAGRLDHQLVLSIAAGLTLSTLSGWLGGYRRIVRAMPNTPALIGAGMAGVCALPEVSGEERALAERALAAVGDVLWVGSESEMDAITAVSGSGPAYLFLFIEAMEEAATRLGFAPETARKLAVATTLGAARLAENSDESPALLRERVTSRGGTTAAALAVMAEKNVAEGIIAGVLAARDRSQEMAQQMAQRMAQ